MQLDHVVLAVPDLDPACEAFEHATGTRPVAGGSHVGLGTRNALASVGGGAYLEIMAPDPAQDLKDNFGAILAALPGPELIHWAIRSDDLEQVAARATSLGLRPGKIRDTSRAQPDGPLLEWRLLGIGGHDAGGFVPFFIDWLDCIHPATTAPAVGVLTDFILSLPADEAARAFAEDTAGVTLVDGPSSLSLRIETPRGELRYSSSGGMRGLRL